MAEKCARLVRDRYEDSGDVCRRSDRWVRGGTTSGICSDPLLVCSGDRLTDGVRQECLWSWRAVVRVGSRWERAWRGEGMLWREEWK